MTCKTFEKKIPLFLKDELDNNELRDFLDHAQACDECKEELSIELLVREGLLSLESGKTFDLQKELGNRVDNAEHSLKIRENLYLLSRMLEAIVLLESFAVIALFFILN